MHRNAGDLFSLTVDQQNELHLFRKTYEEHRRVHIDNFLVSGYADHLFQHLLSIIGWRTYVVANEHILTVVADSGSLDSDKDLELIRTATEGAGAGFASVFDASRFLARPDVGVHSDEAEFAEILNFVDSRMFIDLVREITGVPELSRVEAHVVRFRVGHFVTFHGATASADASRKRRASFVVNLTPLWRPEWGGLLQFRGREPHLIETIQPCFNSLDIFVFPQGHWVSPVTPLATGFRYDITGHMYVD